MQLQPHDLRSDKDQLPTHVFSQEQWDEETWDVGLGGTSLNSDLRALVCQKADSPLFYLTYGTGSRYTISLSEMVRSLAAISSGLRLFFAYTWSKGDYGRAFFLNEHLQLRQKGETARFFLLLSRHGLGLWRDLTVHRDSNIWLGAQAEFRWMKDNKDVWLYEASSDEIIKYVHERLTEPRCDMAFARMFASLSIEERRSLLWPCKRGNTVELERILHLALLAHQELWGWGTRLVLELDLRKDPEHPRYRISGADDVELPKIIDSVLDTFSPQPNRHATKTYSCLQGYNYDHLKVEVEVPSDQEYIEAVLDWRAWAIDSE